MCSCVSDIKSQELKANDINLSASVYLRIFSSLEILVPTATIFIRLNS